MSRANFETLKQDFLAHVRLMSLFVQDVLEGADPAYALPTRVICEFAWHAPFIQRLLIVPKNRDGFSPKLTIINLSCFKADPACHGTRSESVMALDLANGLVLIGGTQYAGEMKKSEFTVLNYLLPDKGVLPMHCSANVGPRNDSAVFFGLSGTGKTTLSADPGRTPIGEDELGWSERGVFNFEGGCYAKVIRLSKEAEPEIFATTHTWGTVLENVTIDAQIRRLDLNDGSTTENTRSAYPLSAIASASETGMTSIPKTVVMLTADAFGVLPPIAKLTRRHALYHFLSGYTAKVAGTENGTIEPQATFSTCFGAPFTPRHPSVYGNLLESLVSKHGISCFLVNTGWTGGAYGIGHRMPIKVTRALLNAALEGRLDGSEMRTDPNFGFAVPVAVEGVDENILNPREAWAKILVDMFIKNFAGFEDFASTEVKAASPVAQTAAE